MQTVHPDGSLTRTVYDINNRPIVSQSEYRPSVQTSAGELEVSDSGGTRTVYDGFGRVHFTETLLKVLIAVQLFLATFANAERTSRGQIDDAGRRRLTQDVIPNSSSTTLQREFRHGYDSGGRLATESAYSSLNAPSTTAAGAAVSYTVNPFGNRTKRDIAIHAAQDPGYSGKIGAVATYSYDNQDKLTGYTGNSTFSWDSGGNVVNTGTGYTYTHDRRNRLRQSTGPTVTASMAYDPTGIRVKKTVGTTTTLYLVDSMNPTGYPQVLCEYQYTGTGTPSIQRSYTYGLDLISDKQGTTRQYYSVDALGTTRFLTSSGATASLSASISAQFHYDAFGTLLGPGTDTTTPYLYTGEQWDRDVGAYYLRARWYSVGMGRFLERDSYEGSDSDPISRNRYLYAFANPVNNTDPSGHWSIGATVATVGIVSTITAVSLPSITHVQKPGFGQSMIPIIGSTWNAAYNFQEGNYGWTAFNVAMAASDVFLVRTIAKAGVNAASRLGQVGTQSMAPLLSSVGQWVSRPGGIKLLDAGGHFVKAVDPAARGFTKWFAETLLEAQARALRDLGEMAPKFFYSEGKLVIENAGKFNGGAISFLKTRAAASFKMGEIFNDVVPRNMGAGGTVFDPALHPFHVMANAIAAYLLSRTLESGLEVYNE